MDYFSDNFLNKLPSEIRNAIHLLIGEVLF